MRVRYDEESDVAYIEMSSKSPDGGVEISEGVILHTTLNNEIAGIEILDASKRFPLDNLYKLELVSN